MRAWFREDSANIGKAGIALASRLRDEQAERKHKAAAAIAIYHGEQSDDPHTVSRFTGPQVEVEPQQAYRLDVQIAKPIIQTAAAKIGAKQRPKGVVLTRGADYRTRVMAKRISKWGEALLHHRQGPFANSWDLFVQLLIDSMRWDAGVVKVYGSKDRETIVHERCRADDILADEFDAEFGQPQTLVHMQRYDRDNLAAMFPAKTSAIMSARAYPYEGGNIDRAEQHAAVYELWRLPLSKDKPGKHIICVDAEEGLLVEEDWTREGFPFAFLLWDRNEKGIWSTPLIDVVAPLQGCVTGLLNAIEENIEGLVGGFLDYEEGTYSDGQLQSNTGLRLLPRRKGTAPVNIHMPTPFNPMVLQVIEMIRGLAFESTGINEMAAQGRKDPGITSGVAIRTTNDVQTERFLVQARAFEQLAVDVLRLDIEAANELAEEGISVVASMPRHGGLETIDFTHFRDAVKSGNITIQPASATDDTLAARKQLIQEFAEAGYIKPEVAEGLLASANVDVDALSKREMAQQRWLEQLIGKFEEYDGKEEVFEPPDPLMNLDLGIMTMTDAYFEFKADGAPEPNRRLILDWIEQADALIAKRNAAAPAPAPGPEGMPPEGMGPPEGMPPDGMMPPDMGGGMPPMPPEMMGGPPPGPPMM